MNLLASAAVGSHDRRMTRSCLLLAAIALAACTGSSTFADQIQLSGSYHFSYAPPDGSAVSDDMPSTVFVNSTTSGACCLAVFRTGTTLTIRVGSSLAQPTYPDPATGACPAMARTEIDVGGVIDGAQLLDAGSGTATMFYQQAILDPNAPADPCPQSADASGTAQLTEPIALSGQIKLAQLECEGGESPEGDCALQAQGSWAIEGIDLITGTPVLFTSGSFAADDQRFE
jgi:hypothetical protein